MEVNPAAALAIQVVKGILSMGWTFWRVGHVKRSHSRGPPPVTIKTCLLGVLKCQLENRQFRPFWDGARDLNFAVNASCLAAFLSRKARDHARKSFEHFHPAKLGSAEGLFGPRLRHVEARMLEDATRPVAVRFEPEAHPRIGEPIGRPREC